SLRGSFHRIARAGHGARATWGTEVAPFFVNGATFATWGVHIPTIKARASACPTPCCPSPCWPWPAAPRHCRDGSGRTLAASRWQRVASMASGLAYALAGYLVMIPAMPDFRLLLPALARPLGARRNAAVGLMGMNAQAATVEKRAVPGPVMSGLARHVQPGRHGRAPRSAG
ncbi:hypothetical protein ACTMU2_00905, partial [Cupriavidus basilensis]